MTSTDSPPPEYQIHMDRVSAIQAAITGSLEIKTKLKELSQPVNKLSNTLGDAVDMATVRQIRNELIKLPATYSDHFSPVRQFSVDLQVQCARFAELIRIVEDPDSSKDTRLKVLTKLLEDIKTDTSSLAPAIAGFKQLSGVIHQMAVDLVQFGTSETKALAAQRKRIDEELDEKRTELEELKKEKLTERNAEKKKKLEEKIGRYEESIRSREDTLTEIARGLEAIPEWVSVFRQQAQKASGIFASGPELMQSALQNVASQLLIDVGGIRHAVEGDVPITSAIVNDVEMQYKKIAAALVDLARS